MDVGLHDEVERLGPPFDHERDLLLFCQLWIVFDWQIDVAKLHKLSKNPGH